MIQNFQQTINRLEQKRIMIRQRDIVMIDFDPSAGNEIQKRRPALVVSKDNYNKATSYIIVCPITSTAKDRPYLTPIKVDVLSNESKVNTTQLHSFDFSARNAKVIDRMEEEDFYIIAQKVLLNFSFPF